MKGKKRMLAALFICMTLLTGMSGQVLATDTANATTQGETVTNADGTTTTENANGEKTAEELEKEAAEALAKEKEAVYKLPVQSNELKNWPEGPGTYGDAAIVMDADTGAILYAKNIDAKEFPASITKVLTALLAYEYGDMNGNVTITPESLDCLGSGYASIGMKEGNIITMDQAMHAMLMASSNEVAYAVGEAVAATQGQDYEWFIEQMNEKVKELGGVDSNFVNTNGVHEENHYTSARDMALIGKALFEYPQFFDICQTQEYTIPASATTEEHIFQQKHKMLIKENKDYYDKVIGGKTGYTTEALNTLITMARDGDTNLVCVVLKTYGGEVYSDTKALLEYGFNNFKKVSIADNERSITDIPDDAYVTLPEDVSFKDLDTETEVIDEETGLTRVSYLYEDMVVGTVEVGAHNVPQEAKEVEFGSDVSTDDTDKAEEPIWSKTVIVIGAAIVVVVLIFIMALIRRAKRRKAEMRRRKQRRKGNKPPRRNG